MNTDHFIHNLKKRSVLQVSLGTPVSFVQVECVENRLGVQLSNQVKLFYQTCNGLVVTNPPLKILPLAKLLLKPNLKIEFAILDNEHVLSFDTSRINEADQWDILNSKSGYVVTKTIASFWSNKVFAWLDKRREIWKTS